MRKKPVNKLNITLGALLLAVILGYRIWQDFNPDMSAKTFPASAYVLSYVLRADTHVSEVPGNSFPLLVPQEMTPRTFQQRQVRLLFNLKEMPEQYDSIFEEIKNLIDVWSRQGTTITAVILNLEMNDQPDWQAFDALSGKLRAYFDNKLHSGIFVKPEWFRGDEEKTEALKTLANISIFYFPLEPQTDMEAYILDLGNIKRPFVVVIEQPLGNEPLFIDKKPASAFNGFALKI